MAGVGRRRGVGERWYPDDIWKRHRQTYREEARPGIANAHVAFCHLRIRVASAALSPIPTEITEHPLCTDRSNGSIVFQIIGSTNFDR